MLLLLATIGCGSTISNGIFLDDADFVDALPSAEHLSLSYPVPAQGMAEDPADLYTLTVATLAIGGSVLDLATGATAQVLAVPPTERGEDYRVWGPFPYDPQPDWFLRVELTRSSTGGTYTYAFQVGPTSAGPWWEFLEGQHQVGEEEVALGEGEIDYDDLQSAATVHIDYDLRDGRVISATVEDLEVEGGTLYQAWTWTEEEDGARLSHTQPADAIPALRGSDEDLAVESRWQGDGAGRADAWLTGGDLLGSTVQLRQCWDPTGATTWSWDSQGWTEELGGSEACVIDELSAALLPADPG